MNAKKKLEGISLKLSEHFSKINLGEISSYEMLDLYIRIIEAFREEDIFSASLNTSLYAPYEPSGDDFNLDD